jgi:toxin ParE1/3/4
MKYVFHPDALTEYAEAVKYYTEQRIEIAQAFIDTIEDTIFRIGESPIRYAAIEEDVRRCRTRKFPYSVIYSIDPDYILILAIMHHSREPGYWKSRLT